MLIFLITFFISFVGSIHPGPLNLSVIQTTLEKGLSAALLLAFGGVIPEIIYGYLAVEGVMIFEKHPNISLYLQWAVVPILWGLGIKQIIAARQSKQIKETANISSQTSSKGISSPEASTLGDSTLGASTLGASTLGDSTRGFFLSLFNPQLLPYWIVILINYQNYDFLKIIEFHDKILFVFGASLGAFALNYLYAYVTYKQRELIFKYINQKKIQQIIGYTFIIMGIFQVVKLKF
jgi:hypothetical protein